MGNDMFNDEQLADAEVRAQASGIILSRDAFLRRLHVLADTVAHNGSLLPSEVDLSAHDAALRLALAEATRERDEARERLACAEELAVAARVERDEARAERDTALLTVRALTPAANYCLEYKPLLRKAEAERDRLRSRAEELEEDLIDIPDVAK